MIRKPLSPAVLALLAAGAVLSSCVMVVRERPGSGEWSSPEEYRETYAFEPGGTISIESGNGAIEISGWKESEVEVRATRREKGGEEHIGILCVRQSGSVVARRAIDGCNDLQQ